MKYTLSSTSKLLQGIKSGDIKSLLIHGVNSGFACSVINKIIINNNFLVSEFDLKDITANRLLLIANNSNFFRRKELIKITGVKNNLSDELKKCIIENNFEHFICFYSIGSLPPNGIRSFFEKFRCIASIGCYYENENRICTMILQQCKESNKNIQNEALLYLKSNLKGDNQVIKSELKKILQFVHDKPYIEKKDIVLALSPDLVMNEDKLCFFFAKKEIGNLLSEINKLKMKNRNLLPMIRSLARYYLNIYIVTSKIESGEDIDLAINLMRPPIFFKNIADFKEIIQRYSAAKAVKYLKHIQRLEVEYKKKPKTFNIFFSLYLIINLHS